MEIVNLPVPFCFCFGHNCCDASLATFTLAISSDSYLDKIQRGIKAHTFICHSLNQIKSLIVIPLSCATLNANQGQPCSVPGGAGKLTGKHLRL